MAQSPDTVIVVPCYNEAVRLPQAEFAAYAERSPRVRFLFVDDGSRDDTGAMLERLAEAHERSMSVLRLERNQGKAGAVRAGVLAAFDLGPKYVGYWDADLATPLSVVDELIAIADARPELLLVLAARVRLLGRDVSRSSVRHFAGRVFATAASLTIPLPVYDTQCGAKLLRVCPETRAAFAEPFISRWVFDVELLARLRVAIGTSQALERRLYEHPLAQWIEVGDSRLKPIDLPRAAIDLARIYLRHRR